MKHSRRCQHVTLGLDDEGCDATCHCIIFIVTQIQLHTGANCMPFCVALLVCDNWKQNPQGTILDQILTTVRGHVVHELECL